MSGERRNCTPGWGEVTAAGADDATFRVRRPDQRGPRRSRSRGRRQKYQTGRAFLQARPESDPGRTIWEASREERRGEHVSSPLALVSRLYLPGWMTTLPPWSSFVGTCL